MGMGEAIRDRRARSALALGPVRGGDAASRLPDRPPARLPPRRPRTGSADRRQPDADLVLAGGPLLRAARLLRRPLAALLRAGAEHPRGARPGVLVAGLDAGPLQSLL